MSIMRKNGSGLFNKIKMKYLLIAVKIAVTVIFVVVVNKSLFSTEEALKGLVPVDLLFPALLFSFISIVLQGYRWFIFLKIFGMDPTFEQALRSYLEGVLFAIITPGRAGELFRGYSLKKEWLKMSSIAVVVERLWATVVLFLTGALAYLFLVKQPETTFYKSYSLGITIAGIASFVALWCIPFIVKKFRDSARKVRRGFVESFFVSLLIHGLLLIQVATLVVGRLPISFNNALIAVGSAFSAMQFMPITMANMGVREFNLGQFMSLYTPMVSDETFRHVILSTSVIVMISNLLFPAIPGVLILLTTKLKRN